MKRRLRGRRLLEVRIEGKRHQPLGDTPPSAMEDPDHDLLPDVAALRRADRPVEQTGLERNHVFAKIAPPLAAPRLDAQRGRQIGPHGQRPAGLEGRNDVLAPRRLDQDPERGPRGITGPHDEAAVDGGLRQFRQGGKGRRHRSPVRRQ